VRLPTKSARTSVQFVGTITGMTLQGQSVEMTRQPEHSFTAVEKGHPSAAWMREVVRFLRGGVTPTQTLPPSRGRGVATHRNYGLNY
jgi:hypothetical protein